MKLLFAILFITLAFADDVPYTNCGSPTDKLKINTLTMTPVYPPKKGAETTLSATGTLSEAVEAGQFEIIVKFMGIVLLDKKDDLCTFDPQITCPIPVGDIIVSKSFAIPSSVPSGLFDIQLTAKNTKTGSALFCIKVDMQIG